MVYMNKVLEPTLIRMLENFTKNISRCKQYIACSPIAYLDNENDMYILEPDYYKKFATYSTQNERWFSL
jgi:hypothetical protein